MATSLQMHGYIWFCTVWLVYVLCSLLYQWLFNDLAILSDGALGTTLRSFLCKVQVSHDLIFWSVLWSSGKGMWLSD